MDSVGILNADTGSVVQSCGIQFFKVDAKLETPGYTAGKTIFLLFNLIKMNE